MQSITVIINGAQGKMGSMATETLQKDPRFEVVGALEKKDNLAEAIAKTKAEVVIDLTCASQGFAHANTILNAGARAVLGTSGFLPEHIDALNKLCQQKKLGAIVVPNFSIGAILMMHCASLMAKHMPGAEIIELHHDKKQEAPSGTALKTAEMIAEARKNTTLPQCEEIIAGARGAIHHDVPIHSVRLPGLLAHQSVMFGATGETVTIRHDTMDRQAFMPGVLLACEQVMAQDQLIYGLEHFLL